MNCMATPYEPNAIRQETEFKVKKFENKKKVDRTEKKYRTEEKECRKKGNVNNAYVLLFGVLVFQKKNTIKKIGSCFRPLYRLFHRTINDVCSISFIFYTFQFNNT